MRVGLYEHEELTAGKEFRGNRAECSEVVARAALAVALMLEEVPSASEAAPLPTQSASPPSQHASSLQTTATPRNIKLGDTNNYGGNRVKRFALGAGLGAYLGGAAPAASAAAELEWTYRDQSMSLGLIARALLPSSSAFPRGTIQTTSFTAGASGCVEFAHIGICIPVALGAVLGQARGIESATADSSLVATLGLRSEYRLQASPALELAVFAEGHALVVRPQFAFRGATAWKAAPFALFAGFVVRPRF